MINRIQNIYQKHTDFFLLLILFVVFRILTLAAFRPGGLVLDFSDFYWYRGLAELTRQGYYPYDNLWTTYPPLFPVVMIAFYQLSVLIPPWEHANLWFTLLLGGFFLLFEIGNFILLYLFGLKLFDDDSDTNADVNQPNEPISLSSRALRPCWIYAGLFVPVYTLTGWFESYPLFFFLLSLYLLLQKRPYLSALFTGIGFMIKLIPLILTPIAIQLLSQRRYALSFSQGKFSLSQSDKPLITFPFDLLRSILYFAIFVGTVIVIALPFYQMNPDLIFGPQLITGARQPWETVWALIDNNYEYGIIPLDMRDLSWTPGDAPPTQIPWLLVTGLFALVYAFFYSRKLDWHRPRNTVAFAGFTLCLFLIWSKGYSPQWLGWPLFFTALLLPNLRGVIYAMILSLGNIIEANFFFIIFPEDRWLLATVVIIRTFLFLVLAIEFLLLIWPQLVTPQVERARSWGITIFVALLLIGAIPAGQQLGQSYFTQRKNQSPYAATIERLQGETVTGALLLNDHSVYDWFYPYLRQTYSLSMLDDYDPPDSSVEERTMVQLNNIRSQTDVLWVYDANAAVTSPSEEVLMQWLNNTSPAHLQDIDGGRLYLFILQ